MRILSIDLPWGNAGAGRKHFGLAAVDAGKPGGEVALVALPAAPNGFLESIGLIQNLLGAFDLVLLDQPIGGGGGAGWHSMYRPVERAFGNSAWAHGGLGRFQCPRFQPGGPLAEAGLRRAEVCLDALTAQGGIVMESFPQLSIPSLLAFAGNAGIVFGAIHGLKSHKAGADASTAQGQLVRIFKEWTGRTVRLARPGSKAGRADAVDALLALLPALEWAAPNPARSEAWSLPLWLNALNPESTPLPSQVGRRLRLEARARWASPLIPMEPGTPGIRTDGLISMAVPGWLPAAAPARRL
jgi:hypothetical protein